MHARTKLNDNFIEINVQNNLIGLTINWCFCDRTCQITKHATIEKSNKKIQFCFIINQARMVGNLFLV